MKYTIVSDDDGHDYVIPARYVEDWYNHIEEVYHYWRPGSDYEGDPPEEPEWVERIDGGRVVFEEWEIV